VLEQGVTRKAHSPEDAVPFWEAGTAASGQFHCADCGYGVSVQVTLPTCPMCGGRAWELSPTSPFARTRPPL
jgi:rubrerythrin